jgi:hypothetical protein
MYEIVKIGHNSLRWILMGILIYVIISSWAGVVNKKTYGKADRVSGGVLVGLAHLQLLIGLILYFGLSPITKVAFADFGAAMKDTTLRFYAVEHFLTMVLAIGCIQAGRTLSKKAADDAGKFKKMAIFTTIALVLILARMPHWNF